ncbi:MAG: methylenetetrahydrofolate reductase C-terminal domain-containing protein [Oscillospiraceae bacterium]|nr:methylenetetrahydrofolate reductase C-terminal domain-containing protein [Oscillospiraceae bacterium]
MLITQLKTADEIKSLAGSKTVIISCEGCKEVHFPAAAAGELQKDLLGSGTASKVIRTEYVCSPENLSVQTKKHMDKLNAADTIVVFSCGVGVQSVSEKFAGKPVFAGCDTLPLPGYQGVTPLEVDCDQCGECYLNSTGGICPIASCSKSLVNGQCGGCKDGKCEVDKEMECAWDRIYKRLDKLQLLDSMKYPAKLRNFAPGS